MTRTRPTHDKHGWPIPATDDDRVFIAAVTIYVVVVFAYALALNEWAAR